MLLFPSFFLFFWLTFLNAFSLISAISQFAAVIIVVKKRLINNIPLFYCNDNHDGDF